MLKARLFLVISIQAVVGFSGAQALAAPKGDRPDILRLAGAKNGTSTRPSQSDKSLTDIPALDAYFLIDNSAYTFFADADRASCKDYASFGEFIKALRVNELDERFTDHAMGSYFGDVFLPANSSCIVTESKLFKPPKMIAMMNYRSVLLAVDTQGNTVLREYVDSLSDRRFYDRPLKYVRPDKIQCRWGIYIFDKKENTAFGEYMTLEPDRQAIYREFARLETALKEQPRGDAVAKFLAKTDLPEESKKSVIEQAARASQIVLECDMSFAVGFRTYPTFLAEQAEFNCDAEACSPAASRLQSTKK